MFRRTKSQDGLNLYWGDLHAHCGISYGKGSLSNAFANAKEHLDFCSVVGHATWHDIDLVDKSQFQHIVDIHQM